MGSVEGVVVEGLVKRFRWFELRVPRLEFRKGLNMVVGPNGSGKSTLLKLVAGFTYPNEGIIRYVLEGGREIAPYEAYGLIAYVAEDLRLPNMHVWELLKCFSGGGPLLKEVIEVMGLKEYLLKRYYELSSGFRRRVQIALALLRDANVIILDEPFSNVDVLMIPRLKEIITEEGREGRVVIFTSHLDLNMVPDRLTVLNQGRVVYHGEPEEIFSGRCLIRVRLRDGGERVIGVKELNRLLRAAGAEVLDIRFKDTSEILLRMLEDIKAP